MTGFVPPQDFRYKNNEFQMARVRKNELPCSFRILGESDPDFAKGNFIITFRSTAVDMNDTIAILNNENAGEYVVTEIYDPYRNTSDRSMKGRFLAAVCNRKGE